jgi:hypothetical protein
MKTIEEKIKAIEIELIHDGYIDGWQIQYLKDKKVKLEQEQLVTEQLNLD